jgi:DNA-binding HxlR family transcriptional regulator
MATRHSCECCGPDTDTSAEVEPAATCYCSLDGVLDAVAKKYGMQVVALLGANGPMRYGELEDALAVTSASTFSERLSDLVDAGLIERRSFDEVPPRVEYSLTTDGRVLEERLQPLLAWASQDR